MNFTEAVPDGPDYAEPGEPLKLRILKSDGEWHLDGYNLLTTEDFEER